MRLAIVGLVLALAAGCKGELNAIYCAEHRDDVDCLVEGVDLLDAAKPECTTNPECAGNPNGAVCDTSTKLCVQCIDNVDETACAQATQHCGSDQKCHGCVTDDDCMSTSGVCLASQMCAEEQNILYAEPSGDGPTCTRADPCKFNDAVDLLSMQRHIIKLTGTAYSEEPIVINESFGVQIIGTGVTFTPEIDDDPEDAITAEGTNLEILGLTIQGAGANAVRCTAGILTLQNVTLRGPRNWGVEADACNVTIKHSRISQSPAGAISVGVGTHEISNNFIFDNGVLDELETGAIFVRGASGRVAFNTIVRTLSRGGGTRVGGVKCTAASAGAFAVAQNIVVDWGKAGTAIDAGCTVRENFEKKIFGDAKFVSTTDFHLTAQSPLGQVRDAQTPAMSADCSEGAGHIDDIDAEPRPFNSFCDRGADEYRP